jgi:hypothetical protein
LFDNNIIANTGCGISFSYFSPRNRIFHNNFLNNTQQTVTFFDSFESWDDGYPSGGNYWSDYVGTDVKSGSSQDLPGSDSIGDKPYIMFGNNVDRYPLMNPYGSSLPPIYALTITTTTGGTTNPVHGTYSYTANSTIQVTAIPNTNYLFDHWEFDTANVGSANPYTFIMSKNHTLKAVFSHAKPSVPVGGYSFPICIQTKAESVLTYIALIATLTAIFTKVRPKTKRNR